jgi:phage terminase small subunit
MPSLTPKQERFCEEYIVDFNATQAARRAGYSGKSVKQAGTENISKPSIQARIKELQQPHKEKLDISAERVLEELSLIAFARPKKYMNWDNSRLTLISSDELTEAETAAIASVSYKETSTQFGGTTQVELKFHDKVKALTTIIEKYLDMDAAIALLDKRGFDAVPRPIQPAQLQGASDDPEAEDIKAGITEALATEIKARILGIDASGIVTVSATMDSGQESS